MGESMSEKNYYEPFYNATQTAHSLDLDQELDTEDRGQRFCVSTFRICAAIWYQDIKV